MYNKEKIFKVIGDIINTSNSIAPHTVIAQPRRVKGEMAAQNFRSPNGMGIEDVDLHGFSHGFVDVFGEKVDVARNYLIEQVIESGAKYMFFVGEDTVVPYHAFKTLLKTCEDNPGSIAVGVYYIKLGDPMIMVKEGNWIVVPNCDPGQIFPVHMCGMDCMLIPVEVLKRLKDDEPELPFCCIFNATPEMAPLLKQYSDVDIDNPETPRFVGEDNFFMHRIHQMGIPVLCNTDVQCLHMDLATGRYTAHPNVDLSHYKTQIQPTGVLTEDDRSYLDKRWHERLPKGTSAEE
jgi:hypothetical protein